jgi:hypothetical protein
MKEMHHEHNTYIVIMNIYNTQRINNGTIVGIVYN